VAVVSNARLASLLALGLIACSSSEPEGDTGTEGSSTSADDESGNESSSETTSNTRPSTGGDGDGDGDGEAETGFDLDAELWALLGEQEPPVVPLEPPPTESPALIALGEALFFDPILSGNKETACASCHHPEFASGDALPLSIGTGATGLGPARAEGDHPPFIARHAQSLFNSGDPRMTVMFWDGRVAEGPGGELTTPAGNELLPGVNDALAAQAMFPVTDRAEMRGEVGEIAADGMPNELADLADDDFTGIWAALTARVIALPNYAPLLGAAFPSIAADELTFAHLANAIGAYERSAFASYQTPFDDYLGGDVAAISDGAKLGAILFYSSGGCAECHSGNLFTDNEFHNTGVPQLGPGKAESSPFDHGRELVTADSGLRFAFRTPSLRNVDESAPYMHNGAYPEVGDAIVHYVNPLLSAENYDLELLLEELQPTVQQDAAHIEELTSNLSPDLLTDGIAAGLPNIRAFLETLTDHNYEELSNSAPNSVPSGLPLP
jgi:cytochrome c peroxidase